MITNPRRDIKKDTLKGKVYDGFIVDNNDPNKMDRARIRIPGIHTNIADNLIPWADAHHNVGINGAAPGMGECKPLPLYTKVRVEFLDDEGYHPIYTCAPRTTDLQIPDFADDSDYPNLYGHVDSNGSLYKVDTAAKTFSYTHGPSGTNFSIAANGDVTIISNNITHNTNGVYTIHAPAGIILDGPVGVSGTLSAMGDVIWNGNTSGKNHTHSGVQSGGSDTETPNPNTSADVASSAPTALVPRTAPTIKNMANQTQL